MQVTRIFASLTFFVAVVGASLASGQIMGRPGQIAQQPLGSSPYTSTPEHAKFDPANFDYDLQAFAPLDISSFDEEIPVDSGFFASWDRTYLSVDRPKAWGGGPGTPLTAYPSGADWKSGNLFTAGNMNSDGTGWDASYLRSSGLFFNAATDPASPRLTETAMHFVELNRAFRQPLTRGGFIEPYFGLRYRYFRDNSFETTQQQLLTQAGLIAGTLRNDQEAINSIIGGGVGFRLYRQSGRWKWTFDAGLDGGFNTQSYNINESYDDPTGTLGRFALNRSGTSFVPNADCSAQLTYKLTRDVSLKTGATISYMWSGLTRADTRSNLLNANSSASSVFPVNVDSPAFPPVPSVASSEQGTTVAGFTFGIEWRR